MNFREITVGLAAPTANRTYAIRIGPGLLDDAGAMLRPFLKRLFAVVVTDANVDQAQGERLRGALDRARIDARWVVIEPGEASKSFAQLEALTSELLDLGVERGDLILAFGGGVIGDLTGFAAAILRRGCRFVQIPTTLLAQVDSAVGGKTAINAPQGKNLIGAFHQPVAVFSDLTTLSSLPDRHMRAGYAEIVKYGLLGDAAFFDWLDENKAAVLARDEKALTHAISRSCEMKAEIVAADEREAGRRALLNLGHTFGHALEAHCGFSDRLLHGEAVSAGLGLAFDYAVALDMCAPVQATRAKTHLQTAGLPASVGDIANIESLGANEFMDLMAQDKKVETGELTLILPRAIGAAEIVKRAATAPLHTFLKEILGR